MNRSDARTISVSRRKRLLRLIPPRPCAGHTTSGEPCGNHAVVGATVCHKHGARAPQVRAAAARRISLAEALESGDRRHPQEVLASALHGADVLARRTQALLADGDPVTADMIQALLDSIKTQATMAKLVLDASGPEQWSAQEAYRQQADALAKICQEMARRLGHDPSSDLVREAFEGAVARVVHGRRGRPKPEVRAHLKAIEGEVV